MSGGGPGAKDAPEDARSDPVIQGRLRVRGLDSDAILHQLHHLRRHHIQLVGIYPRQQPLVVST